jgi:hypothetical protein
MDPVVESQWLYRWQGMDPPAETETDPSIRPLKETRLREEFAFQIQSSRTREFLRSQAERLGAVIAGSSGEVRFRLPDAVVFAGERKGERLTVEVPPEFRDQTVSGFLNRLPLKEARSAFRTRLSQLEHSGYPAVRLGAALLRYAVVRHIVHDLVPEADLPGRPAAGDEGSAEFGFLADARVFPQSIPAEDPREAELLSGMEAKVLRRRRTLNVLHQAVALAPYMYTDEEYRAKRNVLTARLASTGHELAHRQGRRIVRKIWRRAMANSLDRGLSLSLPYFDDQALEMKLYEFAVIPPGRTMFVPAFVALAARREQEKVEQCDSFPPSTRMHLLAELKDLERAFADQPD